MKFTEAEARELVAPLGIDLPIRARKKERKAPTQDTKPHQIAFLALCQGHGLPAPIPEYAFDPVRKWQFDYLFEGWLAVEQEGGLYGRGKECPLCKRRAVGAHSSIERIKSDMEKYNEAAIAGFTVLRFRPEQMSSGEACATIKRALGSEEIQ